MSCLVEGCTNDPRSRYSHKEGKICEEHWFKLPMELRKEYWKITEFGSLDTPEELAQRIRESLNADTGKPDQAEDQGSPGQVP